MNNVADATLVGHDESAAASWIVWAGLRLRVPIARRIGIGAQVQWSIPGDAIRLPARGPRPQRPGDTPFTARLLGLRRVGARTEIEVAPLDSLDQTLVLSVASDIVARKQLRVGDPIELRLRGDASHIAAVASDPTRLAWAFAAGAAVATLAGLIGLGGAEFRLPLLIAFFGLSALSAVILNKAMSLVVVASALIFRAGAVPFAEIWPHWPVVVDLLAGSLLGAWLGAGWAVRVRAQTLHRAIAVLLVLIAVVLMLGHDPSGQGAWVAAGWPRYLAGAVAGLGIGVVAALLGVAGGELLIPTLVLLFGVGIKLAGSLSLVVSLPTMLVGFARYSRDRSFAVLARNRWFLVAMAAGSIAGAGAGGLLLRVVPAELLMPALALILIVSAFKVWRHR